MSDLPRVLLCSFDVIPGPTGSSRRLTEYLRELSAHFSVVVLSAKTPDHSHIQRLHGARLLRVPVGAGDLASRVQAFDRAVRRQLESEEYALAHFTDPFGGYAICEMRESLGYRLIYEAQGFPSLELSTTHPPLECDRKFLARVRRQELYCLMNADRVITGSEVGRTFIHGLGVPEEQVEVLPSAIDPALFTPALTGAPDRTPMRVLYLGSQVAWQGLHTLMRAVKRASVEVELQLSVVGPTHPIATPLLEDLVAELGIGDRVTFRPPVPDEALPGVLGEADVGVVPLEDVERNRSQGGPLSKVSEYLAAGRPIIAADLPLTRERVPAEAAVFHPPGDADALAAQLVRLGRDPALRVRLGRAARDSAQPVRRGRLAQIYAGLARLTLAAPKAQEEEPFAATIAVPSGAIADAIGTDPAITPKSLQPPFPAVEPVTDPAQATVDPAAKRVETVRVVALAPLLTTEPTESIRIPAPPPPPTRPSAPPLPEKVPDTFSSDAAPAPKPPRPSAPPLPEKVPDTFSSDAAPAPSPPRLPPALPASPPPLPPPIARLASPVGPSPEEDEPREISAIHVLEAVDPDGVLQAPDPAPAAEIELADDAVLEPVEDPPPAEAAVPPAETIPSNLDPWFAQLVHGYCPPEGAQFARPTPPTNFPGREGPPPPTVQPTPPSPQSFPTRSGGG